MVKNRLSETGLDIGSSSVKYLQLTGTRDKPQLAKFDFVRIERGSAESLKKALLRISKSTSAKEVNVSISGPSVVVRYIVLRR